MYPGNTQSIMARAGEIAGRLLAGERIRSLMKAYHCGHELLMRAILSQIPPEQWAGIRAKRRAEIGRKGRFKKGHVPWDKGVKGIHLSPATQFKKGKIRGTAARKYRAVGSVTERNDKSGNKYRWIKIKDWGRPQDKYIPYARYVWQKHKGPIPPGMLVVHADGKTLNDNLDNLRLVDRPGHIRLMQERDPGIVKRMRANAAKANKRKSVNNKRSQSIKAFHRVRKLREASPTVWECQVCMAEYGRDEKPGQCSKCGSLRLAIKKLRLKTG